MLCLLNRDGLFMSTSLWKLQGLNVDYILNSNTPHLVSQIVAAYQQQLLIVAL